MRKESLFKIFSVAIVADNKPIDSNVIEVYPIELMYNEYGDVNQVNTFTETVNHIGGGKSSIDVEKRVTYKAAWLPMANTNRKTAPNVRKGEHVLLFRYGNTDQYFWVDLMENAKLRRKERVVYMYGNTDDLDVELDGDNTYWSEIDTVGKQVRFHTSDNDGEATTYDITIDTSEGKVTFEDGVGNSLVLDSVKKELSTKTGKKINLETEECNLTTRKKVNVTTGDNITIDCYGNISITLKKLSISNGSNELISVLVSLLDAMLSEKHIDPQGGTTTLDPGSVSAYSSIKSRLQTFKE